MELQTLLLGALSGCSLIALCFLARLVVVLWKGPECKPGAKGSVCVLVVAGSGKSQANSFFLTLIA